MNLSKERMDHITRLVEGGFPLKTDEVEDLHGMNYHLYCLCDTYQAMKISAENEAEKLKAENERLQRFETAYKEFSDKTDWVRPAAQELGMHVADILRKRCDDLNSHNRAQADEIVRLRSQQLHWVTQPGNGLIRCVSDERYRKFAPSIRARYEPIVIQESEVLRRNAERYRYLREGVATVANSRREILVMEDFTAPVGDFPSGAEMLDAAVDAALAQEQQP